MLLWEQDGRARYLDIFERPGEWGSTSLLGEGNVPKGTGSSRQGSVSVEQKKQVFQLVLFLKAAMFHQMFLQHVCTTSEVPVFQGVHPKL